MERLLALDEQYKKEVETNKIYKEQLNEYASKINDLEKKVNIMTKSMMSSSCISLMTSASGATNTNSNYYNDDTLSVITAAVDDYVMMPERDAQLALWAVKRWKYHQNLRLMVRVLKIYVCMCVNICITGCSIIRAPVEKFELVAFIHKTRTIDKRK